MTVYELAPSRVFADDKRNYRKFLHSLEMHISADSLTLILYTDLSPVLIF